MKKNGRKKWPEPVPELGHLRSGGFYRVVTKLEKTMGAIKDLFSGNNGFCFSGPFLRRGGGPPVRSPGKTGFTLPSQKNPLPPNAGSDRLFTRSGYPYPPRSVTGPPAGHRSGPWALAGKPVDARGVDKKGGGADPLDSRPFRDGWAVDPRALAMNKPKFWPMSAVLGALLFLEVRISRGAHPR